MVWFWFDFQTIRRVTVGPVANRTYVRTYTRPAVYVHMNDTILTIPNLYIERIEWPAYHQRAGGS